MQRRIPFQDGWAFTREPGLPVPVKEDDEDSITFEEPPASPDPSSGDTSVYMITPSVETPGPPTPPPSADPHLHVGDLIRAAAQRLQGAAPAAAVDAAPNAAPEAAAAAPEAAVATPPSTPLRRSARLAERARREEEDAARARQEREEEVAARALPEEAVAHPHPRRGPQRVAKMSTGGVRRI